MAALPDTALSLFFSRELFFILYSFIVKCFPGLETASILVSSGIGPPSEIFQNFSFTPSIFLSVGENDYALEETFLKFLLLEVWAVNPEFLPNLVVHYRM